MEERRRKDLLLRQTHECELALLRAASLPELLQKMTEGLERCYQLQAVRLILHDPRHEIRHLLSDDSLQPAPLAGVQLVDSLLARAPQLRDLEHPWLGHYDRAEHELLVPPTAQRGSLAVIPLRRNAELEGVLILCSADPQRFMPDLAGAFLAHLGLVAEICTENVINRAQLVRSGLTDFLTGFHNRRYLHARLREELARAQRAREPLVCLMIDLDHFKRINDEHGHLVGDAVLREVAHRIEGEMRVSDTGARFGGDEFAIVLAHGSLDDGERLAFRVLEAVRRQPITVGVQASLIVTVSIGVAAAFPGPGAQDYSKLAQRLLAAADAALYHAKSVGRDQVMIAPSFVA